MGVWLYSPGGRSLLLELLVRVSSSMILECFPVVLVVGCDVEGFSCVCFRFFAGLVSGLVLSQVHLVAVLGLGLYVWGPPL